MRYSKLFLIPALAALSVPQIALADTVVEFKFVEMELASEESRAELLDRIFKHSRRECRGKTPVNWPGAVRDCADELTEQFVAAIGNEELSQLAATGSPMYRSASR